MHRGAHRYSPRRNDMQPTVYTKSPTVCTHDIEKYTPWDTWRGLHSFTPWVATIDTVGDIVYTVCIHRGTRNFTPWETIIYAVGIHRGRHYINRGYTPWDTQLYTVGDNNIHCGYTPWATSIYTVGKNYLTVGVIHTPWDAFFTPWAPSLTPWVTCIDLQYITVVRIYVVNIIYGNCKKKCRNYLTIKC